MDFNFDDGFGFDNVKDALPDGGGKKEKKDYNDERLWKLTRDENDTGTAIIRLLPDLNNKWYEQVFSHSFKIFDESTKKNRWFIDKSPQTIGKPCPVTEHIYEVRAEGTEESKELSRLFSRKIDFYTNILVVKDPSNPENNGKIFLWKFGPKLRDKFVSYMSPSEEDVELGVEEVQVWNPMKKGANIFLKIKRGDGGFLNYDDTKAQAFSEIFPSKEEAIETITKKCYDLSTLHNDDEFKSYDDLKSKLQYVLTGKSENSRTTKKVEDEGSLSFEEKNPPKETPKKVEEAPKQQDSTPTESSDDDDWLDDV